jgi:hypothetical protein
VALANAPGDARDGVFELAGHAVRLSRSRIRSGSIKTMAQRMFFSQLPVGHCFASSATATRATNKKIGPNRVRTSSRNPSGFVYSDQPIWIHPCTLDLGGRKRKRSTKRKGR